MRQYKVEVRNSPNWRAHTAATLGVSIESPNWKEEKFAAILDFAARNFNVIRIDVTDTLYRHNFMAAGVNEEEAFAGASALGALWLARHQSIIDACPVKPTIIRWSEWLTHPNYRQTFASFKNAFDNDTTFRDAIEKDADQFYRRLGGRNKTTGWKHSVDFLIEEVAVISIQAKELSSARLYPGDELECLKVVRSGLVANVPDWLKEEQFAKIKFRTLASKASQATQGSKPHTAVNE